VTAHDERVKCLVTSAAVTDGERWLRLIRRPWEWLAFRERVMARRRVHTGEATVVQRAKSCGRLRRGGDECSTAVSD
jgi:hypothetical protein